MNNETILLLEMAEDIIKGIEKANALSIFDDLARSNNKKISLIKAYSKSYKSANIKNFYSTNVNEAQVISRTLSEIRDAYSEQGIKFIAELILELSKYYCPVVTGKLRDSGHIELIDEQYSIVYDAVSSRPGKNFGEGYAVYVHEIFENMHRFPGRAKFLEDAAYEVLNWVSFPGKPLFTFEMSFFDKNIELKLNSIDKEQFIKNLNDRNTWYFDLIKNQSGGDSVDN
ncbi:MAG: hypothetical protein IJ593_07245 [Lachnospiraceae bacterium]|nr:hypothetical protein [Lachnospiraceae bacterium]